MVRLCQKMIISIRNILWGSQEVPYYLHYSNSGGYSKRSYDKEGGKERSNQNKRLVNRNDSQDKGHINYGSTERQREVSMAVYDISQLHML